MVSYICLHYLGRLLAHFCFSSKRYQIRLYSLEKGISYRIQNFKKSGKIKEYYYMWQSNTFLQLVKESLIALWAITKGNLTPFRANCMRNPGICMQCR
jgi:hypothetical protein